MNFFQSITTDQPFFRVVFPTERSTQEKDVLDITKLKPTEPKIRRKEFVVPHRQSPTKSKPLKPLAESAALPSNKRQTNQEFLDSLQLVSPQSAPIGVDVVASTDPRLLVPSPIENEALDSFSSSSTPFHPATTIEEAVLFGNENLDETRNFLDIVYKGIVLCSFND
jgi:hypothetical protein